MCWYFEYTHFFHTQSKAYTASRQYIYAFATGLLSMYPLWTSSKRLDIKNVQFACASCIELCELMLTHTVMQLHINIDILHPREILSFISTLCLKIKTRSRK